MSTEPRHSFTAQLRAWWGGNHRIAPPSGDLGAGGLAYPAAPWTQARVRLAEHLWGEGFLDPIGPDTVLTSARPLRLAPTRRVLEIGSGLGGPARLLARTTGAAIDGVEADPVLAAIGAARSSAANLASRASVRGFDPERADFPGRYDGAIVRGALLGVSRKNELIEAIARAMRPGAPVLIFAFVLRQSGRLDGPIEDWRRVEPGPVHPWALTQLTDRLRSRRFALIASEDVSEDYVAAALTAWQRFKAALPGMAMDEALRSALFREGALWARRLAALDAGGLRFYRFLAEAPG